MVQKPFTAWQTSGPSKGTGLEKADEVLEETETEVELTRYRLTATFVLLCVVLLHLGSLDCVPTTNISPNREKNSVSYS